MTYQFDIEHAQKYGVEEAILLQNLIFWIAKNRACEKHFHDGRTWTYNSAKSFEELFPFWNAKKIYRLIESLKNQKVIITGNYNTNHYDRTLWYALVDESMAQIGATHFPKKENQDSENEEPIPDISTDSKPSITAFAVSSPPKGVSENNSQSAQIEEIENQYFESYKSIFASEPLYQYPKNRALIKRRLKELSVWQIKKCIRLAARDEWIKTTGFQLATILSASVLGRLKDMRDPWGIPEIVKPEQKPDNVATPEQVHAAVAGFKARIAARELANHA